MKRNTLLSSASSRLFSASTTATGAVCMAAESTIDPFRQPRTANFPDAGAFRTLLPAGYGCRRRCQVRSGRRCDEYRLWGMLLRRLSLCGRCKPDVAACQPVTYLVLNEILDHVRCS